VRRYLLGLVMVAFLIGLIGRTAVYAGKALVAANAWDGMKQEVRGKVIIVDPGHGGDDPGVVVGSIREKELTLPIAQKLKAVLEEHGAKVILTRDADVDLGGKMRDELMKRVQLATDQQAHLYISIHANKENCNCWGAQTFYQKESRPEAKALAFAIQNQLRRWTPTTRTPLPANYYVLRHSPVPATLVEVGFLSNGREASNLRDPAYQALLANAMALGIADYFQQERSLKESTP
jgi:N-acetylmuramoyl-L-alanine amidase